MEKLAFGFATLHASGVISLLTVPASGSLMVYPPGSQLRLLWLRSSRKRTRERSGFNDRLNTFRTRTELRVYTWNLQKANSHQIRDLLLGLDSLGPEWDLICLQETEILADSDQYYEHDHRVILGSSTGSRAAPATIVNQRWDLHIAHCLANTVFATVVLRDVAVITPLHLPRRGYKRGEYKIAFDLVATSLDKMKNELKGYYPNQNIMAGDFNMEFTTSHPPRVGHKVFRGELHPAVARENELREALLMDYIEQKALIVCTTMVGFDPVSWHGPAGVRERRLDHAIIPEHSTFSAIPEALALNSLISSDHDPQAVRVALLNPIVPFRSPFKSRSQTFYRSWHVPDCLWDTVRTRLDEVGCDLIANPSWTDLDLYDFKSPTCNSPLHYVCNTLTEACPEIPQTKPRGNPANDDVYDAIEAELLENLKHFRTGHFTRSQWTEASKLKWKTLKRLYRIRKYRDMAEATRRGTFENKNPSVICSLANDDVPENSIDSTDRTLWPTHGHDYLQAVHKAPPNELSRNQDWLCMAEHSADHRLLNPTMERPRKRARLRTPFRVSSTEVYGIIQKPLDNVLEQYEATEIVTDTVAPAVSFAQFIPYDLFLSVIASLSKGRAVGSDGFVSEFFTSLSEAPLIVLYRCLDEIAKGSCPRPAFWNRVPAVLIPKRKVVRKWTELRMICLIAITQKSTCSASP